MARNSLSASQKDFVVDGYVRGDMTQDQLAARYDVSRRTIQRALIERGVLPERQLMSADEAEMLTLLDHSGISSPAGLRGALKQSVTSETVHAFLVALPKKRFWTEIARAHARINRFYKQKTTATEGTHAATLTA